jgi:hypothetical protein
VKTLEVNGGAPGAGSPSTSLMLDERHCGDVLASLTFFVGSPPPVGGRCGEERHLEATIAAASPRRAPRRARGRAWCRSD